MAAVQSPLRIGVMGCGNISDIYLTNAPRFPGLAFTAVADLNPAAAAARGATYGLPALTPAALLASPEVDAVLNLTIPAAHAEVSLAAIAAGKHVYSEKPMATTVADARRVLEAADAKGLRVGMAPDTFLGAGVQLAGEMIAQGQIGRVCSGFASFLAPGMEDWHPNPGFFFKADAGPVMDMGPYYITALVTLLGPVARVTARGTIAKPERLATAEGPMKAQSIKVETFTTLNALLSFASGAEIVLMTSFDVKAASLPHIELFGTEASLRLPDPNAFGGAVACTDAAGAWVETATEDRVFGVLNDDTPWGVYANYRGLGLAEMAAAIREGRPHRASGQLGLHVLEVMRAIVESAGAGQGIDILGGPLPVAPLTEAEARLLMP